MEPGKIYRLEDEGNAILAFGVMESTQKYTSIPKEEGIGVELATGKVVTITEYPDYVYSFENLTPVELENFSKYYSLLQKLKQPKRVLTISGKSRSGKDTLAEWVIQSDGDFYQTALGDPIRSVQKVIYGESDSKNRDDLIMIGQGMRAKDEHVWIKVWLRKAIESISSNEYMKFIVSDVRQPNEFSFFKSLGAFSVRIDANEEKRKFMIAKADGEEALDEKLLNDETESHVENFETDLVIYNNYNESYELEMDKVAQRLR